MREGFKNKRERELKGQITRSLRKSWKWGRQVTIFWGYTLTSKLKQLEDNMIKLKNFIYR